MIKKILLIIIIVLSFSGAKAQNMAVRVNTLALATGTLNAGIDFALNDEWSLDVSAYYNPISTDNLRLKTQGVFAGVRKWRLEPFSGSFIGVHTAFANYDIGDKVRHYKGYMIGAGMSYGYSWAFSKKWNFTLEGGLGLFYQKDKKQSYYTPPLDDINIYHYKRFILAPSKLEISFTYLILK